MVPLDAGLMAVADDVPEPTPAKILDMYPSMRATLILTTAEEVALP